MRRRNMSCQPLHQILHRRVLSMLLRRLPPETQRSMMWSLWKRPFLLGRGDYASRIGGQVSLCGENVDKMGCPFALPLAIMSHPTFIIVLGPTRCLTSESYLLCLIVSGVGVKVLEAIVIVFGACIWYSAHTPVAVDDDCYSRPVSNNKAHPE